MPCVAEYIPKLRARGFRITPQRLAILHVLHHAGGHLSPVEVHQQASSELPRLTETTVYRTLEFLSKNGLARPALTGSGKLVYEIAHHDHHHIICRICEKEIEIEHERIKQMYEALESTSGYCLTGSHLTFFGICQTCQKGE
ncbi:peroxide-responsive transcriptional repressor PerR [Chloroflexota bacterium]